MASCREPSSAMRVAAEERTAVPYPLACCLVYVACCMCCITLCGCAAEAEAGLEHSSGHALPYSMGTTRYRRSLYATALCGTADVARMRSGP